ncbi:hypothetical protein BVG79_00405 [Ketogulonicigenium robustum]|uniref:ATPase n=2 Tax=Ketogulonicigenium robustum TaxID=92947 RepID=A0A1W6NX39_9RHOB|nr:hypothetical protein BVG79_00405 [Ketogulonicigenium robustum]
MVLERGARAFWPAWVALASTTALTLSGWVSGGGLWGVLGAGAAVTAGLAAWGARHYRHPTPRQVIDRLDATMAGQPLATLLDSQATGTDDPQATALWHAHIRRMIRTAGGARAVAPHFDVAKSDSFGLRYMALIALVVAAVFGQRSALAPPPAPDFTGLPADIASWEGWAIPPGFTGLPTLYLGDQPEGSLDLPEGTRIQLNLYDTQHVLSVEQTVAAPQADAQAPEQVFTVAQDGTLIINGAPGAEWDVGMLPDQPPEITLLPDRKATADGQFEWPFTALDDYAITGGHVTITLDLNKIDRRHGLATAPEGVEPIVLDLPLPFSGARREVSGTITDTLSQTALAGLPVIVQAEVTDAAGQIGRSEAIEMILPGKRFFQPVARAIAEQRRDLLWSPQNAGRVLGLLRATAYRPETLITNRNTRLRLAYAIRLLDRPDVDRPEVTQLLWEIAMQFEEGALADARARLRRAQERLDEAMRSGASEAEIQELMDELRAATEDYLDMLAQNMTPGESTLDRPPREEGETQTVTQDQIQALMDRIQELMNEGRMAEAADLMRQLNELLENLQMQEGEGGESRDGNGQGGAMQDLQDTLRNQQGLADETFRQMQEEFGRNRNTPPGGPTQGDSRGNAPDPQGEGDESADEQQDQQGDGASPQPGEDEGAGAGSESGDQNTDTLRQAQRALRAQLDALQDGLPQLSGPSAEAAEDALGRAGEAMDNAETALQNGDLPGAIDQQGAALDALREGMQALRDAMNDAQGEGPLSQTDENPSASSPERNDPLGRGGGAGGPQGNQENVLPDENGPRRAEDILNELRRRAGERERAQQELDYLRRLLEQ